MYAAAWFSAVEYCAYGFAVADSSPDLNAGCVFSTNALNKPFAIVTAPTNQPTQMAKPKHIVPALRDTNTRASMSQRGSQQQRQGNTYKIMKSARPMNVNMKPQFLMSLA